MTTADRLSDEPAKPPLDSASGTTPSSDVAAIDDLAAFIWASPTPEHAVDAAARRLIAAGFTEWSFGLGLGKEGTVGGPPTPGRRFVRNAGSLIAWDAGPLLAGDAEPLVAGDAEPLVAGDAVAAERSAHFRIMGAHTDSPNLRLRPHPDRGLAGWRQVGVEVYGGALLNSWLDRDLGLAGTAIVRDPATGAIERRHYRIDRPLLRVPQLAVHLDRGVNESGLVLNPNLHLHPLLGLGSAKPGDVSALVARALSDDSHQVSPDDLVAVEAMAYDLTMPTVVGDRNELFASARLDNQLSCWAAIDALCANATSSDLTGVADRSSPRSRSIPVVALFDHEEVGSTTASGAASEMLARTLRAIAAGISASSGARINTNGDAFAFDSMCARSSFLSVDNAHATHPNYPDRHESHHHIDPGGGPALKINSNQRYATNVDTAAEVVLAAERAGVPLQRYSHRGDLPCGSTIGPTVAAHLGIPVADIGAPQLSMHSARETMATADALALRALLSGWLDPR